MKIKNLLVIFISLSLSMVLVLLSVIRVSYYAQAQTSVKEAELEESSEGEVIAAAKIAENKEVDYYLPYPGILPDHSFYWLKMIRDRVLLLMTRDSVARLERLLLYADKRIGATEVLIKGGKIQLGITTATKAEKYLEQTIDQAEKVKKMGKMMPELKDKLIKANLKHEEILTQVLNKVPDEAKAAVEKAIAITHRNQERLKN